MITVLVDNRFLVEALIFVLHEKPPQNFCIHISQITHKIAGPAEFCRMVGPQHTRKPTKLLTNNYSL